MPHVTVVNSQVSGFVNAINRVKPHIPQEKAVSRITLIVGKVPGHLLQSFLRAVPAIKVSAYASTAEIMAYARTDAITLH